MELIVGFAHIQRREPNFHGNSYDEENKVYLLKIQHQFQTIYMYVNTTVITEPNPNSDNLHVIHLIRELKQPIVTPAKKHIIINHIKSIQIQRNYF